MGEQFSRAALEQWLAFARRVILEFSEDDLEFPDHYSPELLELADQLLAGPWPALLSPEQHAPFDALVHKVYLYAPDEYVPDDYTVGSWSAVGSWFPTEAVPGKALAYPEYQAEFQKVVASLSPELRKLLTYPVTGRPIWRDGEKFPYVKDWDHYLMAYWTAEEVRQIRQEWPFPISSLQVLKDALTQAEAQGSGLTLLLN